MLLRRVSLFLEEYIASSTVNKAVLNRKQGQSTGQQVNWNLVLFATTTLEAVPKYLLTYFSTDFYCVYLHIFAVFHGLQ